LIKLKIFKLLSFNFGMRSIKQNVFLVLIGIFLVAFVLPQVQAAKIYGNVYGPDLNLEKALVEINSTPRQSLVAAEGYYSFELAPGQYRLEAISSSQGILLYTAEDINISTEGNYVYDLILFETPDIEETELDESEIALIEDLLEERQGANLLVIGGIIAGILVTIAVAYLFYRKRKKKKEKKGRKRKAKRKEKTKKEIFSPDETLNRVINFIRKEKRTTQKEIRKQLGMSEAKVSLLITDLEDRGMIRKIKKGRGNVIIYQE